MSLARGGGTPSQGSQVATVADLDEAVAAAKLAETNAETAETNAETAQTAAEAAQAAAEAAGLDVFGGDQQARQGLSGQIRREITEETGTELAGLIRRQSDDLRVVRDYTKSGVTHLTKIEKNTQDTVLELQNAVVELKDINKNTKQAYTGAL